ncbi:hypothetical protein ACHAWF_006157 [Thalassiosira exigua]
MQKFHGRNEAQKAVAHDVHHATDSPVGGGERHSIDLTPENSKEFHASHDLAFVDFFAPWCIWCQRLAPTWELFAAEARRQEMSLGVAKVDCVAHAQMCKDERIMAFPTLRWYEGGEAVKPDYRGDRTVGALTEYANNKIENYEDDEEGDDETRGEHHPGCRVAGHLMVNRVPGNLHVEASSVNHEINSAMTNLTHRVNHLTFGAEDGRKGSRFLDYFLGGWPVPGDDGAKRTRTDPLRSRHFPTYHFHQAFHHHLKVVSTHADFLGGTTATATSYQILEESQLVLYGEMEVPEVKFLWDMSPMSVNLRREGRPWYDFLTNLLAIVGGTYTTLGLINATLLRIFDPQRLL